MKTKKPNLSLLVIWLILVFACLAGALLTGDPSLPKESIKDAMRDAVLHETSKVSLFGLLEVNPAYVSALIVTAVILIFAAAVRIFYIPRFKMVPGKLQLILETAVGYFDGLARKNSPHRYGILGGYLFAAGAYIFIGTLFELLGIQVVSTHHGLSMALPAPLADINGAISMGVFTYLFLLVSGIRTNGLRGIGRTLKEFSLPISMSFRLFGALLSGLLVTELVYYSLYLSFILPVAVGVMFTLLHALIQAYVLTMLTAIFYGEITEPPHKAKAKKESNS